MALTALVEDEPFIMNINNGKFFLLNKHLLKVILKKDEELLRLFEKEKTPNDREVLVSYIEQYNSRHADEAFAEVLTPIEVIMFRRGIAGNEQEFTVAINDTLKFAANEGTVHKFQVSTDTISVCIDGYCEKIKLIKNKINFLQLTRSRNMPRVQLVDRKEGEDLVNDIEIRQRRRKGS
jgi:hypothetical protein